MIYIFDTNVISELMGGRQVALLRAWLDNYAADQIYTTVICEAEIIAGIAKLPEGRRKATLVQAADNVFAIVFRDRVLPLDREAAREFGVIVNARQKQGRPIATFDALIAAIARRHEAAIVTRDEGGFQAAGLTVLNPWRAG